MMEENKLLIGKWGGISLIVLMISTQIFLNMPRVAAETVGTAGWILALYTGVVGFLILILILKLYRPFEGKDIVDIAELAGGAVGRILVGCILTGYFLFIMIVTFREFSEDIKIISLSQSPISYVGIILMIGIVIGAYAGIVILARFTTIAVPIIALGVFLIGIAVIKYSDIYSIMPIMGSGFKEIFFKGLPKISFYSGVILLLWIAPYIKSMKLIAQVGKTSMVISMILLTLSTLLYLTIYPFPMAMENFLPFYQLTRLIDYGGVFQRIESVFLVFWATSAFVYLSIGLYFIAFFFKKAFQLKYYKPLIIPFGILIFTFSLLPKNLIASLELETKIIRNYEWIITFLMSILILITARIVENLKRKRGQRV